MKRIFIASSIVAAMFALLLFVVFVCADILDWPYFRPVVANGYRLHDDRSDNGNGPVVAYTVAPGVEVRIGAFCYPRQSTGVQACLIRVGLEKQVEVEVSFETMELSARDPSGHDIVDRESARKYPILAPNIPGNVLLTESVLPEEFTVSLPVVRVKNLATRVPDLRFERVEKNECVPLLVNF